MSSHEVKLVAIKVDLQQRQEAMEKYISIVKTNVSTFDLLIDRKIYIYVLLILFFIAFFLSNMQY